MGVVGGAVAGRGSQPSTALQPQRKTGHDTNSTSPTLQVRSDAFGYWKHVRGKKYRFAFKAFHFDLAGMYIGYNIVRHDVVLAANGRSYTSRGTVEIFAPDGTTRPPALGCSKATATRFK